MLTLTGQRSISRYVSRIGSRCRARFGLGYRAQWLQVLSAVDEYARRQFALLQTHDHPRPCLEVESGYGRAQGVS